MLQAAREVDDASVGFAKTGEQIVLLAASRVLSGAPSETLVPLYLRRPDATPTAERKRATQ